MVHAGTERVAQAKLAELREAVAQVIVQQGLAMFDIVVIALGGEKGMSPVEVCAMSLGRVLEAIRAEGVSV